VSPALTVMYHSTLEAVALTPNTTQLNYMLLYDNSSLADEAARQEDMDNRHTRFASLLANMKMLSEGGKLAPGTVGCPAPPR
jgi:hypothetical protein